MKIKINKLTAIGFERKKQQVNLQRKFRTLCKAFKLPIPECEYIVDGWKDKRHYKADFAFPNAKLVVEIEGGHFSRTSGHSGGKAIRKDIKRFNKLTELGWVYLRYPFSKDCGLVDFDQIRDVYDLLKKRI